MVLILTDVYMFLTRKINVLVFSTEDCGDLWWPLVFAGAVGPAPSREAGRRGAAGSWPPHTH